MSVDPRARTAVAIGNFDGVHRGHQAVLSALRRVAARRNLAPRMLTFAPHPAEPLGRGAPAALTGLARKIELVERACPGIAVTVAPFTSEFARQSPEQFVRDVLAGELRAEVVMVGLDFRFGHERAGSFGDLERVGEAHGIEAIAEPVMSDGEGPWSSTRIRALVAAGRLEEARRILGRPHSLSGRVVQGAHIGRTLGFPTCNIADVSEAAPPSGVYAALVDCCEADGTRGRALAKGAANLGFRPTVADAAARWLLEVHLFDVQQDLYGRRLRVHLTSRLRDERRFSGLEALRAQLAEDCDLARRVLADWEPDDAAGGGWA